MKNKQENKQTGKQEKQKITQQIAQSIKPIETLAPPNKPQKQEKEPKVVTIEQITHPRKRVFIETFYSTDGNISETCRLTKNVRETFYFWMRSDPIFSALINEQKKQLMDEIDQIVKNNARKPQGITERIFWLKTHHPDYKENKESIAYRNNEIEFVLTRG